MSALAELVQHGSLVVMTPPAPPGASHHAPVVLTVVQLDGDVTTRVAAPLLTPELWAAHQAALAGRIEELRASTAELRRMVEVSRRVLWVGAPVVGSAGLGAGGVAAGEALALSAGPALWAAVAPAVVGLVAPLLPPVRRVLARWAMRWVMRWAAGRVVEGSWSGAGG